MEDNNIKLNGEEYSFNIDSKTNSLVINVTDCSALDLKGYDGWYQYKVVGNKISFIINNNLSEIERDASLMVSNAMYPDKYAYIAISQKGEVYALSSDIVTKNDMSPLIDGEDFTFNIKVDGGDKKCIIKEIKEYVLSDDEYIRIPFDKSLITELLQIDDGIYKLNIHNMGRATEDAYYFEIVLVHNNNSSKILNLHLQYQDLSKNIVVSPKALEFKSNGFSANRILKLNGNLIDNDIEENIVNSLDWLHLMYGFDCIYAYVDTNDGESVRNGNITIYGNSVSIKQDGKIKVETLEAYNQDSIAVVYNGVEYIDGIELIDIKDNVVKLRTNTYENDKYVHDSMITVNLSCKWADFSLDYDIKNEIHIITVIADDNCFDNERKCIMTVKNAEDTEASRRFLLTQKSLSKNLTLEEIND